MKMYVNPLPYGLMIIWEKMESAVRYHVTLSVNFELITLFLKKTSVERDECYISFEGLSNHAFDSEGKAIKNSVLGNYGKGANQDQTDMKYTILIEAEGKNGEIIGSCVGSGQPNGVLKVEGHVRCNGGRYGR